MRTTVAIRAELKRVIDEGEAAGVRRDSAGIERALDRASELQFELKRAREEAITRIGGIQTFDAGPDLATAVLDAGFDLKTHPSVTVDQRYALGVRFKTGSVSGGVDGTEVVDVFTAPTLGLDARYLYTHVRSQGVPADETGVQSYRQATRSLAAPSSMVREITDVTQKPETDSEAEVVTEKLKQIAHVSTGTPNVLLANQSFRSWVNADMVGGYRAAVDTHIVDQIMAAGIPAGGGGANIYEDILYSQEVVRAAGYSPDLVALSPADGLSLQLLQLTGATVYAFAQSPPTVVITPSVGDGEGFVADSSALGILFLSPFSLQAFEENAGQTNSSTVRGESNGLFLVQRTDAAAAVAFGS